RIECYSTALQSRKWPDVYDFLSKDFIEGRSRDAFTQQMNEGVNEDKFIDFYPKNYVTLSDNDKNEQLFVTGCIKLLVGESVRVYSGSLEAIRDSGQWYFSSLPIVNPNRMNGGPNK